MVRRGAENSSRCHAAGSAQRHVELLHHLVERRVLLGEADEEVARLVLERAQDVVDAGAAAIFGEVGCDFGLGLGLAVVAILGDRVVELRRRRVELVEAMQRRLHEVADQEIVEAIKLLAETEGIFAETAGGVTVACAQKLIESGRIPRNESIVLCITGHGLKTQEAVIDKVGQAKLIRPSLKEFESLLEHADQTN